MNGIIGRTTEDILNLFERLVVLLTGMTLVTGMLYVAGNYQDFADMTQQFLLEASRTLGAIAVVSILPALVLELVVIVLRRRWRRLGRFAGLLLVALLTGSVLLGSSAILVLQQPL